MLKKSGQNTTIIWEVSDVAKNILFDDYLAEQLKDSGFKAGFDAESAKFESAVAHMSERASLTQRELAE